MLFCVALALMWVRSLSGSDVFDYGKSAPVGDDQAWPTWYQIAINRAAVQFQCTQVLDRTYRFDEPADQRTWRRAEWAAIDHKPRLYAYRDGAGPPVSSGRATRVTTLTLALW